MLKDGIALSALAYLNGSWIPVDQLALPLSDPAVTQGVSAVERMRAYQGQLWQLELHLQRWQRTVAALQLTGLPSSAEVERLLSELMSRNEGWIGEQSSFGVVLLATPGGSLASTGSQPVPQATFILHLYSIDDAAVQQRIQQGMPLVLTDVQQPPSASWDRNIKVRSRLHYYLADQQARQVHPQASGVLVDCDGTVTETAIANVLLVERGQVFCPEPGQILKGVSLQVVQQLCEELQLPLIHQRLSTKRLYEADEVLLTGTSCGIWFANQVNDRMLASPGPVYTQLRQAWNRLTHAAFQ